jgi:hypothetical protein
VLAEAPEHIRGGHGPLELAPARVLDTRPLPDKTRARTEMLW